MAPVTPSPHRFLPGQRRQASPIKETGPIPTPHQQPVHPQNLARHAFGFTPSAVPQFAPTPRFTPGRASQAIQTQSPPKPSLAQVLRAAEPQAEVVDDAQQYDEDDEMLELEHAEALPTTESAQQIPNAHNWARDLPYSPPKRRRVDDQQVTQPARLSFATPAKPVSKPPTTPAPKVDHATTPRFTRGGSVSLNDGTTPRRPSFLRSSVAPAENAEPLPEVFSPHRRGQRFVSGGLAATLQQWVIEAGQSAAQSRRGQGLLAGEDCVIRVRIDALEGIGPWTVMGRQADGALTRLLLVGRPGEQTSVATQEPSGPSVGKVVGIRAPTWDVTVDGQSWTVGVDWKYLS